MANIRGDSPSNPIRALPRYSALRRGRTLIRIMTAAATAIASLTALSVVVYLGRDGAYFFGFIIVTLPLFFATFALLGGMRDSSLRLRIVGRVPIAAGISGDDVKRYHRAAAASMKAWGAATMAVVAISILAAGPLNFLPAGDGAISHGHYVETSHGAIIRTLTRAEYEQLNMRVLRFAGTISALMLVSIATLLSGALETEKRRVAR